MSENKNAGLAWAVIIIIILAAAALSGCDAVMQEEPEQPLPRDTINMTWTVKSTLPFPEDFTVKTSYNATWLGRVEKNSTTTITISCDRGERICVGPVDDDVRPLESCAACSEAAVAVFK